MERRDSAAREPDALVRKTATDAVTSKACMVKLGYFADEFVEPFSALASGGRLQRRSPLINRGYFSRTAAIDVAMAQFLATSGGRGQCVVLGAGMDTSFFRIASSPERAAQLRAYFELDFAAIVATKASVIVSKPTLLMLVATEGPPPADPRELHGEKYHLMAADLRDLSAVDAQLCAAGWDATLPTLFVSECVLIYMEADEADAVVAWASKRCARCAFVMYEQLHPHDPFGRTMVLNLKRRGCPLRSIERYPDEAALRLRFLERGYAAVRFADMNDVYYTHLPAALGAERIKAIERLEMFDEFEEWHLIQRHYFFVLAFSEDGAGAGAGASAAAAAAAPVVREREGEGEGEEEGDDAALAATSLASGISFLRATEQSAESV